MRRFVSTALAGLALAWALPLASCALRRGVGGAPLPRVAWTSREATLAAIDAWPDGRSARAPWAYLVAIPEDLDDDAFDHVHAAIRARGYGAPHSEPSMLDPTTDLTARLALADPVEQRFFVTEQIAHALWARGIPFGIDGGNSHNATLPRRAVPAAQRALRGLLPASTRWRR